MPGPPKTPTSLRLLRGNPSRRPLPKNEPVAEVCAPDPPEHLSATARAHWMQIVTILTDVRVMTNLDVDALAVYCETYSFWVEATERVRHLGMVIKTDKGSIIQNPYLRIANSAQESMLQLLKEFGMTPASRTRVQAAQGAEKSENPWDDL